MCGFVGNADLFAPNRRICKICYTNNQAKYRQNNKNAIIAQQKEWRQNNTDIIQVRKAEYYEINKNSILEQCKIYYKDNSEAIKIKNAEYRRNHKSERNAREKERRDTDPSYKLRVYLSRDIFRHVKSKNGLSTFDILSYSVEGLRVHLEEQFEPWMNWENHGKYNVKTWDDNDPITWTWQIDHIVPRSKFNYTDIDDSSFIDCWSLTNLRPLSSKTNLVNGSKLERRKK
jgi:hypothetical protein